MSIQSKIPLFAIPLLGILCLLTPQIGAASALFSGIIAATIWGTPYARYAKLWTSRLLSISIIGLGAGMNLITVAHTGLTGIGYTAVSIALTMLIGLTLAMALRTDKETSLLVTVGTAICGGSAIAALAPALQAKHENISVALGVVFMLNAIALVIFPPIGHFFNLSEHQFGLWSALAIHDTSSVVGAGLRYGPEALETGTTVKLTRALWIVPLVFIIQAVLYHLQKTERITETQKSKYPWFILGFLTMAAIFTYMPEWQSYGEKIELGARRLLVLTLFLIGSNLTLSNIKAVGLRPFILGITLWLIIASLSLFAITQDWL
ncbi:MAG: putative sulfate exporter family transporter [Pseudobdellovibrionaceae bacterium]|nr:putative sulfate exporter family transporter [Pseudobdellovibrionaceae bacterium]